MVCLVTLVKHGSWNLLEDYWLIDIQDGVNYGQEGWSHTTYNVLAAPDPSYQNR